MPYKQQFWIADIAVSSSVRDGLVLNIAPGGSRYRTMVVCCSVSLFTFIASIMPPLTHRIYNISTLLLSLALLAFVASKCAGSSFTHDESFTYNHYVHSSFMDIVSYADPYTNNHILNTLCMKASEALLGSSEFTLRLHSILALFIYLLVCHALLRPLPVVMAISGFLLLTINPYLIDFFGLARGYGLSIAFMMASLWFMARWQQDKRLVNLVGFNLCALLASYSNFSMVNYYLAALGSFYILLMLQGRQQATTKLWMRTSVVNLVFMVTTALLIWEPLRKISKQHMLDFGGKSDVVTDTIASVIQASAYHTILPVSFVTALAWLVLLSIVAICFVSVRLLPRSANCSAVQLLFFISSALLLILAIITTQHYILHNDYFVGRFALFLAPLYMACIVLAISLLYNKQPVLVLRFTMVLAAITFSGNFLANANLRSYLDWEYDADTRTMVLAMRQHHQQQMPDQQNIRLGMKWYFEPTVNFYRNLYQLGWLQPANREELLEGDAYYYAPAESIRSISALPHHVIYTSPTGHVLTCNR